MDSVCQGAAIRRPGGSGGVGVCVSLAAMVAGLSFMRLLDRRYTKIGVDTRWRKEKSQRKAFAVDAACSWAHQDLWSISSASYARDRRPILRLCASQEDRRNVCLASVSSRLAVQREALHVPIEGVQRV